LFRPFVLAFEKRTDDGQFAHDRNRICVVFGYVVQQSGNRERLTVAQLDAGLSAPCGQRRNSETGERDAIRKVECAHLRPNLELDGIARNGWEEIEPDTEFSEHDRDRTGGALHDGDGEFASGEEACLLPVIGNQVGFGETLKRTRGLKRPEKTGDAMDAIEN